MKTLFVLVAMVCSILFVGQMSQGAVEKKRIPGPTGQLVKSKPIKSVPSNSGPLTRSNNKTWQWVSLPLRVITGVSGLAIGAVQGGVHGVVQTEEHFVVSTFGEAEENALMVPIGLVGTIAAVPVGFAAGAPQGASQGIEAGYHFWDRF